MTIQFYWIKQACDTCLFLNRFCFGFAHTLRSLLNNSNSSEYIEISSSESFLSYFALRLLIMLLSYTLNWFSILRNRYLKFIFKITFETLDEI